VANERYHVIGLDTEQPQEKAERLDFLLADVRNPLLVELLKAEKVHTVCHLAFRHSVRRSEGAFDANVMGTTKLLGACSETGVSKIVLKSSMAVYGARPTNSAFLTEDHPLRGSKRYGYTRDMVEIETFCNGFSRMLTDTILTNLRFASIVGPTADTPMTRYLRSTWTPGLMGFDPMMQVIHEDDAVAALIHAVENDAPGTFNVAAPEVLPLSTLRGLVGKLPLSVFHPVANWGVALMGIYGRRLQHFLPIEPCYLRYPWVGDLTRMEQELGFAPRYTAEEALRDFAARLRLGRYPSGAASLAEDQEQMRAVIERRHTERGQHTFPNADSAEGEDNDD
jgi:UDP-glucose 4-epimerase